MVQLALRILNVILVKSIYRVRVIGRENLPKEGAALFVCNHVAFSDPPVILAQLPRLVRFLMYRTFYENKFLHPVCKALEAIPVSNEDPPKEIIKSLTTAREALHKGQFVAIFAEGQLTRIGNLLPFSKGFERIVKGVDCPIIPMHLDEVWGSFLSHKGGKPFTKLPKCFPRNVTLSIGKPLPPTIKAWDLRNVVQELGSEAFSRRSNIDQVLPEIFIRVARKFPGKKAISDTQGTALTYFQLAGTVVALSRVLRHRVSATPEVGVLLPSSVGGVLANLALSFLGKVPVNLNFTASEESLASIKKQCSLSHIVTSRAFTQKLGVPHSDEYLYLEDLLANIRKEVVFGYASLISMLPASLASRLFIKGQIQPSDSATVIFSSGSTGEPKGVMLSHANIAANITALSEVFQLDKDDCVIGVLPFFHSFGFTATMWLPLLTGISASYHVNPIDALTIGTITEKNKGTILMSTPTFLMAYIRKVEPEQFKSLRHVIVGAEKLKEKVAQAFHEKFGIMPMEGYGCTELSPVAMLNVRSFSDKAVKQTGNKPGSVGHPLPGVAVRVVDPELFPNETKILPPGKPGLLLVKGANVMKGYINNPEKTEAAIHNGWYVTGDIATIDQDGFVTITDRLSRFSKIGGEMVPHIKVEEEIQSGLENVENRVVVTSVPDERKGEQLVVLYTGSLDVAGVLKSLSERGLPNLWIPKKDRFFLIEKLPVLGTGKLDLREVKRFALEQVQKAAPATLSAPE